MERIRFGNDIAISWALYDLNGIEHNLEDKNIQLFMSCGGLKQAVTSYTIQGNIVSWVFLGKQQKRIGVYKLIIVETDEETGSTAIDVTEAFRIVSETVTSFETNETIQNVSIRSVLTYSSLIGVASVDVVESSDDDGNNVVNIVLNNGKSIQFTIKNGSKGPKGDKGDQGNTGSNINYPFELVNNLETDDATKALSAKQGKVLNDTKVDKVSGKGLSANDYSDEEKAKLAALPTSTELATVLEAKVDKIPGKGLSTEDYSSSEKTKLSALPTNADLQSALGSKVAKSSIADNLTTNDATMVLSAKQGKVLNDIKVDKVSGKGLSDENYTSSEKTKLGDLPTVVQLTATLQGLADLIAAGKAFRAIPNTTTFAQINAAWEAGRFVYMIAEDGVIMPLAYINDDEDTGRAVFACLNGNTRLTCFVDANDTWTNVTETEMLHAENAWEDTDGRYQEGAVIPNGALKYLSEDGEEDKTVFLPGSYAEVESASGEDVLATQEEVNAKYTKPSGGIPKTDLAQAVQTSLGKADVALPASSVVDNLTTEDATKALSAQQGKVLDGKISQLSQYLENYFFEGEGQVFVTQIVKNLVPGRKYRFNLIDNDWDKTGVTAGTLFVIRYSLNGVTTNLVFVNYGSSVNSYYDVTMPTNFDYIEVGGRAALGVKVNFSIEILAVDPYDYKGGAQVYVSDGKHLVIKKVGTSLYFKISSGSLAGRGSLNFSYGMSALATYLGVTLKQITPNDREYIELTSTQAFVIDGTTKQPAIKDRTAVKGVDIILLANAGGYISGLATALFGYSYIETTIAEGDAEKLDIVPKMQTKGQDFSALFQSATGVVEPFIFFSDPHWFADYSTPGITAAGDAALKVMRGLFDTTPTNFVLCGGDWLTSHKQSVAVKDLAYCDGLLNKSFPDRYFPVFGNHDNNYQGELDGTDDTSANDGAISDQQAINLWYRKWGKKYYSFNGTATKFYVLDSGVDNDNTMTSYRWEQVDWLASRLLEGTDEHIVLSVHIVKNTSPVTNFATNITKVAQAFNARSSVTLNGETYDFSGVSGKIHCVLCGHTHTDWTDVINDVPVYCVRDAQAGNFDMILLDYAAGKLKSIRVGNSGSNREMNLVV